MLGANFIDVYLRTALCEEILKRSELQHQLISLALLVPGALAAIAVQTKQASLVLLYPVVALFLSAAWTANYRTVRQIYVYIRAYIEVKFVHMGWESVMQQVKKRWRVISLTFLAARGIFLGTKVLTVIVGLALVTIKEMLIAEVTGLTIPRFGTLINVLMVVAAMMVVATVLVLGGHAVMPVSGAV